jgi:hypothetical protein
MIGQPGTPDRGAHFCGLHRLPSDEKDPGFGPAGEEFVVDIAQIHDDNGAFGKIQALSHYHFMDSSFGQMSEDWQVTIVIQKQMQFHRSFGLAEGRPIVHAQTKINHAGVQAQELIFEAQLLFRRRGSVLSQAGRRRLARTAAKDAWRWRRTRSNVSDPLGGPDD